MKNGARYKELVRLIESNVYKIFDECDIKFPKEERDVAKTLLTVSAKHYLYHHDGINGITGMIDTINTTIKSVLNIIKISTK